DAQVGQHLEQQTRSLNAAAATIARSPLPLAGLPPPAALGPWLDREAASLPAFDGLFVTDGAGHVAAVTASAAARAVAPPDGSVIDRDYFRAPMRDGRAFLSGLIEARGQ